MKEDMPLAQSIDIPGKQGVSHLAITWILMAPLVYFVGGFWFQNSEENSLLSERYSALIDSSRAVETSITILIISSIVCASMLPKIKAILAVCRHDSIFVLLTIFSVISTAWSQNPVRSFGYSLCLALNMFFASYLRIRFNHRQQMNLLINLGWVCLILSIVLAVFFPQYGVSNASGTAAWQGIYAHKNRCSIMTLILLPAAFYAPALTLLSKVSRLVYITLSAYLIMMTQSATGKIILVCLLLYVLVTKQIWKFDSKGRSIILSLAIVVGLSLLSIGGYYLNSLTYILGKDPTLTGRTEIWKSAMDSATKHPILGYGYEAFWRELQGESANVSLSNQWSVTGAHNGFLEVWLTLGIVGLGLVVYAFIRAFSDGLVCAPKSFYFSWCMCIVFLAAIISIDESGMLAGANNMFWIVFMIVCTELTKGAKRIRLGLVSE